MQSSVLNLIALIVLSGTSVHHFGFIDGIGVTTAIWLLMPYVKA